MEIIAADIFCGIGGFTESLSFFRNPKVSFAVDQNLNAVSVYQLNFRSNVLAKTIECIPNSIWSDSKSNFWLLSPPCQPFSQKGIKKDQNDFRSAGLSKVLELIDLHKPEALCLENVVGFKTSKMRDFVLFSLSSLGYSFIEYEICPTQLGIPNRRPRYYLLAARNSILLNAKTFERNISPFELRSFLDESLLRKYDIDVNLNDKNRENSRPNSSLSSQTCNNYWLADSFLDKHWKSIRIVSSTKKDAYTTCFTSSYGAQIMYSGSFLECLDGSIRRFTPKEILRFLGFNEEFNFPNNLSIKQQWKLVGNSISVFVVKEVLASFTFLKEI